MLFSPVHWLGLVAADVRRIVGVALDASHIPRPSKLFYMNTPRGLVVLHPRVPNPPSRLTFIEDPQMGVVPGTNNPVMRLPSDARGVGAVLQEIGAGDASEIALGDSILVPLVPQGSVPGVSPVVARSSNHPDVLVPA